MDGGLLASESPLAPLKGGDQRVLWPVSVGHCSGQPDGAAAENDDGQRIVGANDYSPLRNGHNPTTAAPERPNNIEKHHKSPTTHFNALFSRFALFSLLIFCDMF